MRYVKGTTDFGILFPIERRNVDRGSLELVGFTDSDHGGDYVERKSTSGYIFMLNGSPISWCSKKQLVVALSSCEAEYIARTYAACQGVWPEEVLKELMIHVKAPLQLKIDNMSSINLSKNLVSHGRSKNIEVRYHFHIDMVNKERIELVYCDTETQLADVFTKAVNIERFEWLSKEIGVRSLCDC